MGCLIGSLGSLINRYFLPLSRGLFSRVHRSLDVRDAHHQGSYVRSTSIELTPLLGLAAFFPHIQDVPAREALGRITWEERHLGWAPGNWISGMSGTRLTSVA